jgi:hypothetical protein
MSEMSAEAICVIHGEIIYPVAEALEARWLRLSKPNTKASNPSLKIK